MNQIIFEDASRVVEKVDFSSLRNKTILLTGATGLLGTHFLATLALLNEGGGNNKVFGVCHSEPEPHTKEIARRGGLYLLGDPIGSWLDADVTIHAAGYAQPALFTKSPAATIKVNTTTTDILLNNLKKGGKFLFISSSEVYSGLGGLVTETSIGNTSPLHPRACYIEGKRCGEAIVNAYRQAGVNAKSARLSLAYGPGTRKHDKRAMSQFIEQALVENKIELKYSGREPRTFCYISDAVEVLWQVLLHGTQPVYNVGGESVTNMAGVAMDIARYTGASLTIPTEESVLQGAPLVVSMDLSRIKEEFGKRDFIGLQEGLRRTIDWQRGLYK
jgi:nucleoside-diphosphate-sugar epimerase